MRGPAWRKQSTHAGAPALPSRQAVPRTLTLMLSGRLEGQGGIARSARLGAPATSGTLCDPANAYGERTQGAAQGVLQEQRARAADRPLGKGRLAAERTAAGVARSCVRSSCCPPCRRSPVHRRGVPHRPAQVGRQPGAFRAVRVAFGAVRAVFWAWPSAGCGARVLGSHRGVSASRAAHAPAFPCPGAMQAHNPEAMMWVRAGLRLVDACCDGRLP